MSLRGDMGVGGVTAPLFTQFQKAKNTLEDAHITLCGAVTAHAEAKRALDLAEAVKLCEGVDGKNEAQRTAKLRLELSEYYAALHGAEDALTEARCAYEVARLEWDSVRYQLKMYELHHLPRAA